MRLVVLSILLSGSKARNKFSSSPKRTSHVRVTPRKLEVYIFVNFVRRQLSGDCRSLNSEWRHGLHCMRNAIRVNRANGMIWTRHAASMGQRLCWRNLSERGYFGDLDRHRWKNNIKIDLQK